MSEDKYKGREKERGRLWSTITMSATIRHSQVFPFYTYHVLPVLWRTKMLIDVSPVVGEAHVGRGGAESETTMNKTRPQRLWFQVVGSITTRSTATWMRRQVPGPSGYELCMYMRLLQRPAPRDGYSKADAECGAYNLQLRPRTSTTLVPRRMQ